MVVYLLLLSRFSHVWLCDPIDSSPPGSPVPGILQARTLEWVAISFSNAWNDKWKWSCSVVSDSVRPHRRQPTRLPSPWDSPGKNTGVGYHFLLQRVKVKSLSHVPLLATPWTAAHQAPPSMGFSRQEYWNGVPLPSPIKGLGEIKKNSFHFPKMKIKAPLFCVLSIIQDNSGWFRFPKAQHF